jgi:hypothetical protein
LTAKDSSAQFLGNKRKKLEVPKKDEEKLLPLLTKSRGNHISPILMYLGVSNSKFSILGVSWSV